MQLLKILFINLAFSCFPEAFT